MKNPLVCLCIPTFNAAKTIRETLDSLLNQTYPHVVLKIVDNASTDETLAIVRSLNSERVQIIEHAINVGGEGNFNRCIMYAEGDYTGIFHADDIYDADMLQQQVNTLEANPEVGAVLTEAHLIDEHTQRIGRLFSPGEGPYDFEALLKTLLAHSNFLICPSALVRTTLYQQAIKTWRGDLFQTSADLDVWLRLAMHAKLAILQRPLLSYRISTTQGSEKVRRGIDRADFFKVMDYYLNQPWVKACITKEDLRHYASLDRRDRAMRAANLLMLDKRQEALALCSDMFSIDTLRDLFKNKRGVLTFVLGTLVKVGVGKKMIHTLIGYLNK